MSVVLRNYGGLRTKGVHKCSKESLPLISIITVVYNGSAYLEQTIRSVLNQSYSNIEYVIIDGGSTDATLEIIKKYDKEIDYWVSEPDKGIYDAMNKGLKLVTGELVGIINSDDWYEVNTVNNVVAIYQKDTTIGLIHGLLRYWKDDQVYGIVGHAKAFLTQDMISHPTCFVNRDIYNKYGGFNCVFKIAADYDFMLKLNKEGVKFSFNEIVLSNFRMIGVSISNSNQLSIERLKIHEKYNIITRVQFLVRIAVCIFRMIILKPNALWLH